MYKIIFTGIFVSLAFCSLKANLPLEFYPKTIAYDRFIFFKFTKDCSNHYAELEKEVLKRFEENCDFIVGKGANNKEIFTALFSLAGHYELILKRDGDVWLISRGVSCELD